MTIYNTRYKIRPQTTPNMIRIVHLVRFASMLLLAPQTTIGWSLPVTRREALFGVATMTTTASLMGAWELPALALIAESDESNNNTTTTLSMSEEEEEQQQRQAALGVQQRLQERRQLMEASRSSNSRQSYLDLSRQRAALYNTTSKAVSCPPSIPCL
jgi:hypothetical protein